MGKGSKKGGNKATKGKEMDWEPEGASVPGEGSEGSAVLSAKEKQVLHAFLDNANKIICGAFCQ
jgi:hypothetical protein